jgi:hypothetical protein
MTNVDDVELFLFLLAIIEGLSTCFTGNFACETRCGSEIYPLNTKKKSNANEIH